MKPFESILLVVLPTTVALGAVWQSSISDYDAIRKLDLKSDKIPQFFPFRSNRNNWDAEILKRARWEAFGWSIILMASIVGYVAAFLLSHHAVIDTVVGFVGLILLLAMYKYFYSEKRRPPKTK